MPTASREPTRPFCARNRARPSSEPTRGATQAARPRSALERKQDGECAALAGDALGSDPPAVLLDQLARDREAEAGPARLAVSRVVGAEEALDHVRECGGRAPGAG